MQNLNRIYFHSVSVYAQEQAIADLGSYNIYRRSCHMTCSVYTTDTSLFAAE